jgi:hypothetical protein
MRLIAQLTMPNVGSWNGKFSGENNIYTVVFSKSKKDESHIGNYYYNFGDGWGANVQIRHAKPREKVTKRFFGYEWMLGEIKEHGRILTLQERKATQSNKKGQE